MVLGLVSALAALFKHERKCLTPSGQHGETPGKRGPSVEGALVTVRSSGSGLSCAAGSLHGLGPAPQAQSKDCDIFAQPGAVLHAPRVHTRSGLVAAVHQTEDYCLRFIDRVSTCPRPQGLYVEVAGKFDLIRSSRLCDTISLHTEGCSRWALRSSIVATWWVTGLCSPPPPALLLSQCSLSGVPDRVHWETSRCCVLGPPRGSAALWRCRQSFRP